MRAIGFAIGVWVGWMAAGWPGGGVQAEISDRTRLALETLNRLKGPDAEVTPSLQQAAERIADQLRGEPEFVEVVGDFRLKGREADLLDFAKRHPDASEAGDAIRLALDGDGASALRPLLAVESPESQALLHAISASGDARAVPLMLPLLGVTNRPMGTRVLVLHAISGSAEGASNLLSLTLSGGLPLDLREAALSTLRSSRWPAVRAAVPAAESARPKAQPLVLPPLSELVQLPGDPKRGRALFQRPDIACSACHQVRGEGVDFGPRLSEIGAKLGREALVTAIVEPSAGISFGFEAWLITLKDGDELQGLVASETDDELLIKLQGGPMKAIPKRNIASREKQAASLMPSGLLENLSLAEFGDLLAYLASLKPGASE